MTEIGIAMVVLAAVLVAFATWRKLDDPSTLKQLAEGSKKELDVKFERGFDGKLHLETAITPRWRIPLSIVWGLFAVVLIALYLKYIVGL